VAKAAGYAAGLAPGEAFNSSRKIADVVQSGCKLHGIGGEDTRGVTVQNAISLSLLCEPIGGDELAGEIVEIDPE